MSHPLFAESEHSDDRLRLALRVPPALNHALAHNGVPIVRRLAVHNLTGDDLGELEVCLELVGSRGVLAGPWRRRLGNLRGGAGTVLDSFGDFAPDARSLEAADEAFPVEYRVTVEQAGVSVAELRVRSRVLAHNEWFNAPAVYDLIAAFIQPNTSSVAHVLRRAGQILERRTGSGHLEGYQSGSDRAVLIAGAIYEALRAEAITYVTMPASFEDTGQKVRTTAEVLGERLGNCIDLSVTYAACLEAAGLNPFVFFTPQHAFAGFSRQDTSLSAPVSLDTNHLVNLVQSGMVVPVELTSIGPGHESMDFEQAARAGVGHLHQSEGGVRGVVDVCLAHRSGIKPLLSDDRPKETATQPDSEQTRTAPRIELPHRLAGFVPLSGDTAAGGTPQASPTDAVGDGAPARVVQWRNNLLDLSLRNPLLKLPSRGKGVDLHVPPEALPELDDLVHDHKPITVAAQDAISGVHKIAGKQRAQELDDTILVEELHTDHRVYGNVVEDRYLTRMRTLQREARTVLQETGGNYLYLTLGALVHQDGQARAPLFLLPVRLEGGSGHKPYSIVADGDEIATPNHCLIEWLRVHHGLRIPELAEPVTDDSGIDIVNTLARVRRHLVENNLHYRIESTASLRLLRFSTFQMWRDLTDHWETITGNPVVRHLIDKPGDRFDDPRADSGVEVDEAALHLPIAADGSQMQAVTMAAQGRSFVLEGPPGTGKSQTITNLIAHTIAAGKKVLFVAEKQAALDVVKRRLGAIGFDPFCLDLHGRKQSLPNIRRQLKAALDHEASPDSHGWRAAEAAFRKRLETLRRHPQRVHESNLAGYSVWSAHEAVLANGDGPAAEIPPSYFTLSEEQRAAVEHAARELPTVLESARVRPDHPWRISGLRSASSVQVESFRAAANRLEQSRSALHRLPEELRAAIAELSGPGELHVSLEAARIATTGYRVDAAATDPTLAPGWDAAFNAVHEALHRFREQHGQVLDSLLPELFEHPGLADWHAEAEAAQRSLLRKKKKLRAVAERLRPYAQEGTRVDEETVHRLLTEATAARSAADELLERVTAVSGLQPPPDWLPTHTRAVQGLEMAHHYAVTWRKLRVNRPALAAAYARANRHLPLGELRLIAESWRDWLTMLGCTGVEFQRWTNGSGWIAAWERDGAAWADQARVRATTDLHRWGCVLAQLDVLEAAGLAGFARQLLYGEIPSREAEEAFQRGSAASALEERRTATELNLFDGAAHTHEVREYLQAGSRLRENVPEWLTGKLIQQRPHLDTHRSGTHGELVRQLERKRGGRSFRELLARYPEAITGLTPCFLMSPASVANFLEPGAVEFDLVVFDEASQIRVAEAVGAMGRARSAVVVGDSKQMPPTSFMEVNRGDDAEDGLQEDEPVPEDMDSILSECVESGLPQVWLSWHYRSSDESLIAFSNSRYYDDQLASLPSPGSGPHSGVSARRVQGLYDRGASRTNAIEAEAIVAEIARVLADPATSGRSIGVVTFNVQQRDLLLNLLEDSDDRLVQAALAREDDEALFVKNLENVQGDERDLILFSLAFSVDPATGRLPMNFGPLLREGGQRRLNVAITRARRQVVLFGSFDPADLDLNRTNSVGVRHLREYLETAVRNTEVDGHQPGRRVAGQGHFLGELAGELRRRGYEVAPKYGLSHFTIDLAVRAEGSHRWQVAVLLDSPEWAQRPTVADRDGAPELLKNIMDWPEVVRVWLPSWINDREAVLAEINSAIARTAAPEPIEAEQEEAVADPSSSTMSAAVTPEPRTDDEVASSAVPEPVVIPAPSDAESGEETRAPDPVRGVVAPPMEETTHLGTEDSVPESLLEKPAPDGDDTVRGGAPSSGPEMFVPYDPVVIGTQEELNEIDRNPAVRQRLRAVFGQVVETEGPVEHDRLAKLVLECFEFDKGHTSRVRNVMGYLPRSLRVRESEAGCFVWPAELDPDTWRGFRKTSREERKLDEIAPEEIANAMRYALTRGGKRIGANDELYKGTLKLLGFAPQRGEPRLTAQRRKVLEAAENIGVADGRLDKAGYNRHSGPL